MDNGNVLEKCLWPDLPGRYHEALHEAVHFIIERYPTVIGIVASGTIIRGTPDPSSDFDIYVIQRESFRQRVQRFFNSVAAEIFVNPPGTVGQYFRQEASAGRPLTAHMLATGFKVLDLDPVIERLRSEAKHLISNPPATFPDLTMRKYMIATAFEDAVDVASEDEATARMILSEAISRALHYRFLRDGRYIPREKELIKEITATDTALGKLANRFFSASPLSDLIIVGQQIIDRLEGEHGFFEWETEVETLNNEDFSE